MTIPQDNGQANIATISLRSFQKLRSRKWSFIWPDRIALGTLTILEGRKQCGKSTIAAAIAADVTGGPRLGRGRRRVLGDVLWLTVEEDLARAVRPRLEAAGADLGRVHFPEGKDHPGELRPLILPDDLEQLEYLIRAHGVKLVVLDPLASFVHADFSLNDEQQVRQVLERLARLAARTSCAILLIRHLRKSGSGPLLDHGLGSAAIANVARTLLRVDEYPEKDGRYGLSVVACNVAEKARTLVYAMVRVKDVPRIEWHGESDLDAERLADGQGDAGERDARADARAFLRAELETGEKAVKDLERRADENGISRMTLRRAKKDLGVTSHPRGPNEERHFVWRKPKGGWPEEGGR